MIAIPNMDMPKSCVECHWYYELYDEHCTLGKFLLREYIIDASEEPYTLNVQRHPDCPLIEVSDEIWEALKPKVETMSLAEKGWITDDSNT